MNSFLYLLADTTNQKIFGEITPVVPGWENQFSGISRVFIVGLQIFFAIAAISVLIYLLWGALDWINSGGDPDKISQAQAKMTNAVIGIILVFVALTIFYVVTGPILGIITQDPEGNWIFKLPSINPNP